MFSVEVLHVRNLSHLSHAYYSVRQVLYVLAIEGGSLVML